MTDKWKADFNYRGEMSLFRDGSEVASGMGKEDAELVAHSMNHYRSVVSSLRRIRSQVLDPSAFTDSEMRAVLINVMVTASDTLRSTGEKV